MRCKCNTLVLATLCAMVAGPVMGATINLSPIHSNRMRSDAQTGNSETSSPDIVGGVSGSRWHRSVLEFDLSSVPDGLAITSVSLSNTNNPDGSGNSDNTDDGTGDITVQEMLELPDRPNGWNYNWQSFGPDQTGGNSGDDTPWTTAGATLGGVLSSVADTTYDPEGIAAGTLFTWGSTPAFISAVSSNLADDQLLLQVLIPGLEGTGRSFVRPNDDYVLSVELVPEPSTVAILLLGVVAVGGVGLRRR